MKKPVETSVEQAGQVQRAVATIDSRPRVTPHWDKLTYIVILQWAPLEASAVLEAIFVLEIQKQAPRSSRDGRLSLWKAI